MFLSTSLFFPTICSVDYAPLVLPTHPSPSHLVSLARCLVHLVSRVLQRLLVGQTRKGHLETMSRRAGIRLLPPFMGGQS